LPIPLLAACAITLRTALAQSVIYTEDFNGALGSLPSGWTATSENAAQLAARNDGVSEYEHRLIAENSADLRALSHLADTSTTDVGAWRDTTVEALLRYSGGANNQNGLVARVRNASLTGGDFYHARLNGDAIQLYRFNGATSTLLGSTPTPSLTTITDRLMRLRTENIASAGTDQVQITVELYNGTTIGSGLMQSLNLTDSSTSAITRSGGAGVRSFHPVAATNGQRATFDNFRVTSNRPNLLWYDDYQDNTAVRAQTFVAGGASSTVANQRQEFFAPAGSTAVSLLDFDGVTSQSAWADTMASATVRLNTNLAGGSLSSALLLRENGVTSATGSGDYYAYRMVRDENTSNHRAELIRSQGGAITLLATTPLLDTNIPESLNIFSRFEAFSVPGGVQLTGQISLDINFSSTAGFIQFTDTDAARLVNPGSAGYRMEGGASLVNGAINFDNFMVAVAVPEPSTLALLGLGCLALRIARRKV
jgi:hypothetical protein